MKRIEETLMKIFGKSLPKYLVTIAEIGVNHEGDVQNAINIIKGLAGSGVDAVKLPSYTPEKFLFSWEESLTIGKTLKVNVGAGELINPDHFDGR
jgi:sialic acid synthase SpsE